MMYIDWALVVFIPLMMNLISFQRMCLKAKDELVLSVFGVEKHLEKFRFLFSPLVIHSYYEEGYEWIA